MITFRLTHENKCSDLVHARSCLSVKPSSPVAPSMFCYQHRGLVNASLSRRGVSNVSADLLAEQINLSETLIRGNSARNINDVDEHLRFAGIYVPKVRR